jgi:hypothetical protein
MAPVLKAAGHSYEEIGRRHSWTSTEPNEVIAEGRAPVRHRRHSDYAPSAKTGRDAPRKMLSYVL